MNSYITIVEEVIQEKRLAWEGSTLAHGIGTPQEKAAYIELEVAKDILRRLEKADEEDTKTY